VDLVEEFIARYAREYDFYDHAARLVHERLQAELQASGIRAILTYRAKRSDRLREKCRQREGKQDSGTYSSIEQIYNDIVDLAGIRVALYFPGERDQVDGIITRLFRLLEPRKEFPDGPRRPSAKFDGYVAWHYRVQLLEKDLSEPERRYSAARVEIQVASVLMHGWAEVDHDLAYKPIAGDLSDEEYVILDDLNGLVLEAEKLLERLQKAGEARVGSSGNKISSHFDLTLYLLGRAAEIAGRPISESGLGRVDILFDLLRQQEIDTPERLAPYLTSLHGDFELRPFADQIIDALLAENSSRYKDYSEIRSRYGAPSYEDVPRDDDGYREVGTFVARWTELERLLRVIDPTLRPTGRRLERLQLLDADMAAEFDQLRQMRNYVVHGIEVPPAAYLAEASQRIVRITAEIRRRRDAQGRGTLDSRT
jgi:ppGpp synthetase/RelA/SpoT-type nucleotidyltranferase